MKLLKRLIALGLITIVLSTLITLLILHFFWNKHDRRHSFERNTGSFKRTIEFNSHPSAIFYKLDKSPLATELSQLDRRKLDESVVINFALKPEVISAFKKHEVDVGISDLVPLNRPVPDSRPKGCSKLKYSDDLPTTSIVIPFHNEWPSILLRTVYSIVNRTPKHLLKEVILVDDASTLETLHENLDEQLKQSFPDGQVKLIRLPKRAGLIVARLEGLKHVTAEVVSFFDCHMEVNVDWLPPLLAEIKKDRRTIAMTQLDYINKGTLNYEFEDGYKTRYGFDWRLIFFETYFRGDHLEGKSETDPLPGVVMVGPGFVVDVQYFKELGTYDDQMSIWGGENLELPWRVWLCGGRLVHVPCSRVGHIARPQPYSFPKGREATELRNYKRAVEVWMGDYKKYVYRAIPAIQSIDEGDISARLKVKEKLQCKPFEWFMNNVWPDLLMYEENTQAWGWVKNGLDEVCLDNTGYLFSIESPIMAESCNNDVMKQMFALRNDNQLRTILQCIVVRGHFLSDKEPVMSGCFEQSPEVWKHEKGGQLKHVASGLCMEYVKNTNRLLMAFCDPKLPSQKWTFQNYRQ